MKKKHYKIISLDLQKNLIDFLDEIQFDAAKESDSDSMHKVNFCSWAIKELLNSYDGYLKDKDKKPQSKSRDQYVDETFMDWNLPEMSDEEYEKLVDQFDAFLRGWEKEYNKKNPKKKQIKERPKFNKPSVEDVAEYMSLDEIKEYLLEDEELTNQEAFDLYYEERERRKPKEKGLTYEQLLKGANIKPPTKK
tara:strand:- start:120 stop:698 length:579 start_codon:yes stop_codon:yes gene_type:complete